MSNLNPPASRLEAALDAAARLGPVLPLKPGTKVPALENWKARATRDPEIIRKVWARGEYNIGIKTGGGIVGIDVDAKNGKRGEESFAALGVQPADYDTFTVRTPSGGLHRYYNGPDVGCSSGTRLGPGIDVRGEGGYLVGPGSIIEDVAYCIIHDGPLRDLPVEIAHRLDGPRERDGQAQVPLVDLDRDDAIERATGFLIADARGIEADSNRDRGAYQTALIIRDFGVSEEMTLRLMAEHWNDSRSPPRDYERLAEKVANAYKYGQNRPGVAHPATAFEGVRPPQLHGVIGAVGTWHEPDLSVLEGPQIAPPPFPRLVLGDAWSDWCETVARGANAPFDYPAAGLLTMAAALIGNARVAQAGPTWSEPSVLWTCLVGRPSSGKSPSQNDLNAILASMEAKWAAEFRARLRGHEAELEQARRKKKAWREGLESRAADAAVALPAPDTVEPKVPVRPRVVVTDATVEVVAEISAGNPKGVILVWDELAGWYKGFNRYRGKSGGEEQFWLQAYGARRYAVDRKSKPEPIVVPRLSVGVLGGVQPDLVASLLDREADGLVARFLFVYPEPTHSFSLSAELVDRVRAGTALSRLWALGPTIGAYGEGEPIACRLTTPAAATFERWWSKTKTRASEDGGGALGEWLGKAGGLALRFALVLEHLWWISDSLSPDADSANSANRSPFDVGPTELTVGAINAAINLVDYWAAPMARRTFGSAAASPREREAATLGLWLRRNNVTTFNARDVRRSGSGPGGRLSDAAAMAAACDALAVAGIIRLVGIRTDGRPGRVRQDYEVNPALFT